MRRPCLLVALLGRANTFGACLLLKAKQTWRGYAAEAVYDP